MAYKKPKPTIRYNPVGRVIQAISEINRMTELNHPYRTCLNCEYWNEGEDLCNRFKSKPPTAIIVWGCESYKDNEDIPF